ncbi:SCO family protein [Paenibacillus gansuensis]|uniref:SCO family protein n=1 Tax=Paenibacillus gansuensis TaxID=306542 RepID=A0ABW5PF37_9BACL
MEYVMRKHGFKILILVLCAAMAVFLLMNRAQKSSLPVQEKAAEFNLKNTDGEPVALKDTGGKVRLVYFFFASCPDVCPVTNNLLREVQGKLQENDLFGSKSMMYSITFDPKRDTEDKLKAYANGFKADKAGWQFLRGDEQATRDAALEYGISVVDDQKGGFLHQNYIFLVDKEGNIRQAYNANDKATTADLIVKDINQLSKE